MFISMWGQEVLLHCHSGHGLKWEVQAVIVYIPMHDMLRKDAAEAVHAVPKHEGATTALPDG